MSKKYMITTNAGGIDEVQRLIASGEAKFFDSISEAIMYLISDSVNFYGRPAFSTDEIFIKWHSLDGRIGAFRYSIFITRHLQEKYKSPVFYRWLLEFDETQLASCSQTTSCELARRSVSGIYEYFV